MDRDICVLDSTLRDGGYCNDWCFGARNKRKIVEGLVQANIDFIECGILSQGLFSIDQTKYSSVNDISMILPDNIKEKSFIVLMNYNDYDIKILPDRKNVKIDGIRVAFHKKDMQKAVVLMKQIKEKNYKVFAQPMVTDSYTTEEYIELITLINEIRAYAFYIVDSFGSMKADVLKKYCDLAYYLLNKDIILGFHSHNNLQLSYSNAQIFVYSTEKRDIIVDCSIMGMGRGAGNLNTELFLNYMNEVYNKSYKLEPILLIIDEVINLFYQKKPWGYSLHSYLTASHKMHPNYGAFLADKNTLTVSMMNELMSLVNFEKKNSFDKKYMEDLYISYMSASARKFKVDNSLEYIFKDKEVLVIAPGKSIDNELDKIKEFVLHNNVIIVCINFNLPSLNTDYIFVSNSKRYEELGKTDERKMIITSNIVSAFSGNVVDYLDLLCEEDYIRDNSAMMLIKLLINSKVSCIYLAGVDGYDSSTYDNYTEYSNALITSVDYMYQMNKAMNEMLKKYSKMIDIQFVTKEKMIRLGI